VLLIENKTVMIAARKPSIVNAKVETMIETLNLCAYRPKATVSNSLLRKLYKRYRIGPGVRIIKAKKIFSTRFFEPLITNELPYLLL
jgi:hypothetical protein